MIKIISFLFLFSFLGLAQASSYSEIIKATFSVGGLCYQVTDRTSQSFKDADLNRVKSCFFLKDMDRRGCDNKSCGDLESWSKDKTWFTKESYADWDAMAEEKLFNSRSKGRELLQEQINKVGK
jgi:hypothetical protein